MLSNVAFRLLLSLVFAAPFLQAATTDTPRNFRFTGGEEVQVALTVDGHVQGGDSIKQVVTSEGNVSVPVGGVVNVLGMSLNEATEAVVIHTQRMTGLKSPRIFLALLSIPTKQQQVYVQGAVGSPRTVFIQRDHNLSLAAALAEAGGINEDADISHIKILNARKSAAVVIDASGMGRTSSDSLGPILGDDDVVIVPRAEAFTVTGEIQKPGIYTRKDTHVRPGLPIRLNQVVAAAGGPRAGANRKSVRIIRTDESGSTRNIEADLDAALPKGNSDSDLSMQDGDQIILLPSEGVTLIGGVHTAGVYFISSTPLTITRLIALAGGFQPNAKKSNVIVTHREHGGGPTEIDVKAILEKGLINKDIVLQPGDTVFVDENTF